MRNHRLMLAATTLLMLSGAGRTTLQHTAPPLAPEPEPEPHPLPRGCSNDIPRIASECAQSLNIWGSSYPSKHKEISRGEARANREARKRAGLVGRRVRA